jgi:hypothetical protein
MVRLHADPGGALNERLDDHGGDLAGAVLQQGGEPVDVARIDLAGVEEERPVG